MLHQDKTLACNQLPGIHHCCSAHSPAKIPSREAHLKGLQSTDRLFGFGNDLTLKLPSLSVLHFKRFCAKWNLFSKQQRQVWEAHWKQKRPEKFGRLLQGNVQQIKALMTFLPKSQSWHAISHGEALWLWETRNLKRPCLDPIFAEFCASCLKCERRTMQWLSCHQVRILAEQAFRDVQLHRRHYTFRLWQNYIDLVDFNLQNSSKAAVPTFPMNPIGSRGNFWDRLHLNKPATRVCKWSNYFERRGAKICLGLIQRSSTRIPDQKSSPVLVICAKKTCKCQVSDPSGLAGSSIPRYLIDWS